MELLRFAISLLDFTDRFEKLWKLFTENPGSTLMLLLICGAIGWFAHKKFGANRQYTRYIFYGVGLLYFSLWALASYVLAPAIILEAKPELPWFQTPKERPQYKNYAILPTVKSLKLTRNAIVVLRSISVNRGKRWDSPLNDNIEIQVPWFNNDPFAPISLNKNQSYQFAPLNINPNGKELIFLYDRNSKGLVIEITRWASIPLKFGRYKLDMSVKSDGEVVQSFSLLVDWFGNPETLSFSVEQ